MVDTDPDADQKRPFMSSCHPKYGTGAWRLLPNVTLGFRAVILRTICVWEEFQVIIGYARVSTDDQRLDLQLAALKEAGCDKMFQDQGATGSNMERPGLEAAITALGPGDTLVVWRLDRLGRSLTDLVQFIDDLGAKGCDFRSLNEAVDTCTSGGRLIFHIMAAFAEFERNLIRERTKAGLKAAKQRGSRLGRPPKELSAHQIESAFQCLDVQGQKIEEIAARYRVSSSTLRRRLKDARGSRMAGRRLHNRSSGRPAPSSQPVEHTPEGDITNMPKKVLRTAALRRLRQSVAEIDNPAYLVSPGFQGDQLSGAGRQYCREPTGQAVLYRIRETFVRASHKAHNLNEDGICGHYLPKESCCNAVWRGQLSLLQTITIWRNSPE